MFVNTNPKVIKEGKRDYKGPIVDKSPRRIENERPTAAFSTLITSFRVPGGKAKLKIEIDNN